MPGPVDRDRGTIEQPSRMPGWSGYPVAAELAERLQVCVQVDNDANLAALGEHCARFGSSKHSITVKAGTAIGSGIIVNGRLHRGATAAAGDITHTRIESGNAVVCRCGNLDCLETVASGAGIIRQLNQGEYSVRQTTDVLRLVHDGDPEATRLVRAAGKHLGQALSGIVNFFNPHALFLTGSLSALEPFIASVRGRIYANCHPLVTQSLQVEATITGADAALLGAARLVLDEIGLLA